jgi:hypothetical protein
MPRLHAMQLPNHATQFLSVAAKDTKSGQYPIYLIPGSSVRLCSSRIIGTAPAIRLIPPSNSPAPEHFRSILMTYLPQDAARYTHAACYDQSENMSPIFSEISQVTRHSVRPGMHAWGNARLPDAGTFPTGQ